MSATVLRARTVRGRYVDSVVAMRLSQALTGRTGVVDAAAIMGTPANLAMLREAGLLAADVEDARPDDLVVAVRARDDAACTDALGAVESLLTQTAPPSTTVRSLAEALRAQPDTNLVSISLPGEHAAAEARHALEAGLHVFCFSSDVALDDEVELKALAEREGVLCMGPDCGTAILAGVGLGFANEVRRGPVGVVGGSGTGMQAVTSLLERMGVGTSFAIGAGSRDLDDAVGGVTTLRGLALLDADPSTHVIVVVSKPGGAATTARLDAAAARCATPVVRCVLGGEGDAGTLDAAALAAAREVGATATLPGWDSHPDVASLRAKVGERRFVRGLFSGGSLCAEAQLVLMRAGLEVSSNAPVAGARRVADDAPAIGHCLVDLGTAAFTRGRPHPMIDARARCERIAQAASDPDVAVLLVDVVLGRNAAEDPAGDLAAAIRAASTDGPVVVAAVVGTEFDPQGLAKQVATLQGAGCLVAPTNATMAALAAALVEEARP